ncbi:protein virilizer homolog isoform X3 [Hydra vulgaris]|uniref:Protein virilizer homolog isoform X3 n=1 Tax=Hydra vulgaris TaxID=6087 RepID=A0ABM4D4N4_HYDVU
MEERVCLLFCDTFSHDNEQEMQLDLVRFAQPVVITEIRVIPQGCKVHPEIRDRLGETTPSSFKLEIFARNLLKPNAAVFERLGVLDYEEGKSIQLIVQTKVATNFALVRSWYKELTMCIYGTFAPFHQDPLQVPPPPPMEIARQLPLTIDNHLMSALPPGISQINPALGQIAGLQQLHIQTQNMEVHSSNIPPHLSNYSPSFNQSPREDREEYRRIGVDRRREEEDRDRRVKDKRNRFDDDRKSGRREYFEFRNDNYNTRDNHDRFDDKRERRDDQTHPTDQKPTNISDELFEPLSPENEFFENQHEEVVSKKSAQIAYEDIESDEDDMPNEFDYDDLINVEYDNDEAWSSVNLSFNPYQCTLAPLKFIDPYVDSEFERLVKSFKDVQIEPIQVKQLQDFVVSDSEAERDAKWVTMLEELPNIVPSAMAYLHSQTSQKIKEKHFLSIITEWAVFALNMDHALLLPLAVNIRFLKAGIKLTCLLADCCEEYQRLLLECDVQNKLVDLLYQSHMASSMKLIILKALDATTNTVFGMEMMLGWSEESSLNSEKLTVYGRLISYLLDQTNARVVAAIKPLLQKIHFYEAVAKLQAVTARIAKSQPRPLSKDETDMKNDIDSETKEKKFTVDVNISNKDMSDLLAVLSTVYEVLENGNSIIRQPNLQSFPTTARLHDRNLQDCYQVIVHLLQRRRFLESILVLASSPLFCETEVYAAIRDLIFLLISSNKGLLLLASQPVICNALIRTLLSDDGGDLSYMPTLKQYRMNINTAEGCMPHHLGLLLVYHLQALQCVDKILLTAVTDLDVQNMDSAEHISALHTLYSMTFTSVGRESVSSVLSFNSNINCLLPFLTGGENFETKIKKSVASRYSAILLNITLQFSHEVDWLRAFKKKLLSIPKKENDNTHEDIHHYLASLEKVESFDIHAISPLVEFVKSEMDEMKLGTGTTRSVLLAMRILYDLINNKENEKDEQVDLQGRLNVIEMFSSNAMEIFILTFHKVNEQLLLPWKQNQSFSNENCFILVNIANYLLGITKVLLKHLLMTSFCFQDIRLIQELFVLHKILCSKTPVGLFSTMLVKMQEEIINILILFLQGTEKTPESEDDVKKSTWYILLKELLTFLVIRPENFVTGLVLLSELLPTPLPIHTLWDIQQEELAKVMSCRYLAMVNFSCLGSELKTVIKTLVGSCCSVLQYYLRRSLCQLIDLGSSVSGIVIRTLCEMVDEGINKSKKEIEEPSLDENSMKKKFSINLIYNAFSILSYLVTQPGGKAAFLNLLSTTQDSVTEFPDFITKLINVADKECDFNYLGNSLLPLFQSICDHEICLDDFDGIITMGHLSNNMPDEANTKAIVELLFATLNDDKYPIPIVMRSLNILDSLTDHDYGMNIINNYLIKKGDCLNTFLSRLISEAKNKSEGLVIYNAVSSFFDFLNLINTNGPEDYLKPDGEEIKTEKVETVENPENAEYKKDSILKRCIIVSACLLKKIFRLDDKNASEHPMTKLEKIIEEESKDDEDLILLSETITTFRMILIAAGEQDQKDEYKSYQLCTPDSLQMQFSNRMKSLLMNSIDDDRATANDWFDEPAPDDVDSDTENDLVKIDMLSIATKFLPTFNFKEEVEKGFVDTTEAKRSKRSKRDGFFRAGQPIDDAKRLRLDVSALSSPNTANRGNDRLRGRGGRGSFGRAGYNNRGGFQRGTRGFGRGRGRGRGVSDIDSFRLRRQNTSRPPSMHVDDFMNMEKAGQTVMNQPEQTSSPASNERFSNNNANTGGTQSRWSDARSTGDNFRRANDGSSRHNEYNSRQNSNSSRFHNRSNSDWYNSNYRGTRDGTYRSSARGGGGGDSNNRAGVGSGSGSYWAAPKTKDDERFFTGYRNNRGNRHQRTFTR